MYIPPKSRKAEKVRAEKREQKRTTAKVQKKKPPRAARSRRRRSFIAAAVTGVFTGDSSEPPPGNDAWVAGADKERERKRCVEGRNDANPFYYYNIYFYIGEY